MSFKLIDLLLCFNSLRAKTIEILIIIFSLIGIVLGTLGIIFIPWKITSSAMEILHILILIFSFLSLIFSFIILFLRKNHRLSKRVKRILIFISIFMEFICLFSLIFLIIISFLTFSDLDNKEGSVIDEVIEETGEVINRTYVEKALTTKVKKILTIIIISLRIVIWILLLFLWVSDYVRLIFGMECSYNEYVATENKRQLEHPKRYGLNVIGHDKYGFPIFGKQVGNKIKIKGVKNKFNEKIKEKYSFSNTFYDENGKINFKYYSNMSQKPINKEELQEKINEKEKYLEKYFDGENVYQNYTNFDNKTILNFDDNNNSINPGYAM